MVECASDPVNSWSLLSCLGQRLGDIKVTHDSRFVMCLLLGKPVTED